MMAIMDPHRAADRTFGHCGNPDCRDTSRDVDVVWPVHCVSLQLDGC